MNGWVAVRAVRPLAQLNMIPPLLFGQALSMHGGAPWGLGGSLWAHGFGLMAQVAIVLGNDYADAPTDVMHNSPTIISGGSRVVPEGLVSRSTLGRAALVAHGLLWAYGGACAWWGPTPFLCAAAAGTSLLMWAYDFLPLRLSHRGGGQWLQGLGLGVVLPLVGATTQGLPVADVGPATLVLPLLVGTAGHVVTSLPDRDADAAVNKRTLSVRWGVHGAAWAVAAVVMACGALSWRWHGGSPWLWVAAVVLAVCGARYPRSFAAVLMLAASLQLVLVMDGLALVLS